MRHLSLTALVALILLAGPALAQDAPILRVTGTARVGASPDLAEFEVGVRVRDPNGSTAMARAGEVGRRIVAALKAQGIPETDLQTVRLGLDRYDEGPGRPESTGVRSGYEAVHLLQVRVPQARFGDLGAILDAAVKAGANVVGDIRFTLRDETETALQARGLAQAVQNARAKAQPMAAAAGVTLGAVRAVVESGAGFPEPLPYARMEMATSAPSPVPPTEVLRTYSVVVEFGLR